MTPRLESVRDWITQQSWTDQSTPQLLGLTLPLALTVLVFTTLVYRRLFSPLRDIPGPFLASITRLWHFKAVITGNQNIQLHQEHEKHGPFVRLAPNEVSVVHVEGVKKLMLQPLRKGMFYNLGNIPDWRFPTVFSTKDPKEKAERSKTFASGYAMSSVLQYEDAITLVIEKLLQWMDKHAESQEPMELDKFLTYTTFDVVGEALFSRAFGFLEAGRDVGNAIAHNVTFQAVGSSTGLFRWAQLAVGNPINTMLGLQPGSLLSDTALSGLRERQKNPDARFDLTGHWLRYLAEHPDRTTMRNVQTQTTANVGAGSDTVSCALQSILYYMIRNPHTWARARQEIDAAMREREGTSHGRVVALADAQKLPYLQACIKEGLRINSPVPMGLQRLAPKGGITIGESHFPEGTTLSINPWVLHRCKTIWGEDADEFKPDRWLGDDATFLEKNFIPFGAGYAGCPGKNVANLELSKICATIIRDYDLKLVNPSKEWHWMAYFTMVPEDWPVYVSRRLGYD